MVDSIIFVGFLIINIIYGLLSSRGIKSLKEYAVGNKNFSTAAIAATITATYLSGSGFSIELSRTYDSGLYYMWASVGSVLVLFLSMAFIFAPRMKEFLGKVSIADAMGGMFGKEVRIITSITCFLGGAAFIAMQLKVAGNLFQQILDIPVNSGIIIVGLIIASYSSLGGIKSVTFTDIIQLFTLGTIIPTLAYFIAISMKNYNGLINIAQHNELYNYKEVFDFSRPKSLNFLSLFFIFAMPSFCSAGFQRIAIAKNIQQIKNSHIFACFFIVFVVSTSCFIALLVKSQNPNLEGTQVLQYILTHYAYPGFRGLTVVGIMAMLMSTADSYLNSTAVLFVNDFCKPLKLIDFAQDELFVVRIVSFIIGCIAIFMGIYGGNLLQLCILANTFVKPIVTPVFMMAVFGFRPHKKCVLIGMFCGFLGTFIWEYVVKYTPIDSLLPGMLFNFVGLIASHYILKLPGGWINKKTPEELEQLKQERKANLVQIFNKISNFSFYEFFCKNEVKNESFSVILGIVCIISCMVNILTLPTEVSSIYKPLITCIHISVVMIGTIFVTYPIWKISINNRVLISIFWNCCIFYILVFVGFFLALISDFAQIQLVSLILYLIVLNVVIKWKVALFMVVTGFFIAFGTMHLFFPNEILLGVTGGRMQAIYVSVFLGSIFILFLRPKQQYIELVEGERDFVNNMLIFKNRELEDAENIKTKFINNVCHEYNAPMTGVVSMSQTLYECHKKLTDQQKEGAAKDIYESARRLDCFQNNIKTLHELAEPSYDLKKLRLDLSNLLMERVEISQKFYDQNNKRQFEFDVEKNIIANLDRYYITQVLDNLISNAIRYCQEGNIKISLKLKGNIVRLTISDNGVGIPNNEVERIFNEFVISSRTDTPASGRGVGLTVCKRVIKAHGGEIWAESNDRTIFNIILPLDELS